MDEKKKENMEKDLKELKHMRENMEKEFKRLILLEARAEEDIVTIWTLLKKYKNLVKILTDEEFLSLLSDPDFRGIVRPNICEESIEFISLVCAKGYLKTLKFIHEQFVESGNPKLIKLALDAYSGKEVCCGYRDEYNGEYFGKQIHDPIPLSTAIYYGRIHIVEYFLSIGVMVDENDSPRGCLPLNISCERGYLDMTKLLIEHGANWRQKDFEENDCFYIACCQGFTSIVQYLIELSAEVTGLQDSTRRSMRKTVLGGACYYSGKLTSISDKKEFPDFEEEQALIYHYRVYCPLISGEKVCSPSAEKEESDYLGTIRLLLQHAQGKTDDLLYTQINDARCCFKSSVFMQAAEGGSVEVLDLLLQLGKAEDVNERTREQSPLSLACFSGNIQAVRYLISKGAAVSHGRPTRKMEDRIYTFEPIVRATACKAETRGDILKLLIQNGADLNYDGGLPLQKAIRSNNADAVEILLASGVDLHLVEDNLIQEVCNPLMYYSFGCGTSRREMEFDKVINKMKILRMLLEAGLSSDRALHTLCSEQCKRYYYGDEEGGLYKMPTEMLKLLIYYGSPIDKQVTDNYGLNETALHAACRYLDQEKIRVLANCGANVQKPSLMQDEIEMGTPIEICTKATRGHCLDYFTDDIIRFLCEEKGVDVHTVSKGDGLNLLGVACFYYDRTKLAIVLYYLSRGLTLQPELLKAEFLFQNYGLYYEPKPDPSDPVAIEFNDRMQDGQELLSILMLDNAFASYQLSTGPAGRLVLNLFTNNSRMEYVKPDFHMLEMLFKAGYIVSLPDQIEQEEVRQSSNRRSKETLEKLQDEQSRIPDLAELCRWAVRRTIGPGLVSLQKVEKLPLPKPMIEYVLLLDIIDEEYSQKMFDYFTCRESLKMSCVRGCREWPHEYCNYLDYLGRCPDCSKPKTEKSQIQREREKTRKWAAEFLEQCQEEDSRKAQESYLCNPEDWIVLDEIPRGALPLYGCTVRLSRIDPLF